LDSTWLQRGRASAIPTRPSPTRTRLSPPPPTDGANNPSGISIAPLPCSGGGTGGCPTPPHSSCAQCAAAETPPRSLGNATGPARGGDHSSCS
jgi:hypothetical protein